VDTGQDFPRTRTKTPALAIGELSGPTEGYLSDAHCFPTVRLGLVVIGLVFAVVGGGLVVSFFAFSTGGPPGYLSRTITASQMAPNQSQTWSLDTVSSANGVLSFSWTSSGRVSVSLWKGTGCSNFPGICPVGPPIASWVTDVSGQWKSTGSVTWYYIVTVTTQAVSVASLNATLSESYSGSPFGLGTTNLILVTVGSVLLLGSGAIGVFLGLFLPGGVYQDRRGPIVEEPDVVPVDPNAPEVLDEPTDEDTLSPP